MSAATVVRRYTPEEYLAQEEIADFRHEYRDGEIVPMTGGSDNHNGIVVNLCAFLKLALRGQDYRVRTSNLRLWIPRYRQYTYPDVLVIQGNPVFQDDRTDTVMNPCLVVEVLSKSTQNYDRGDKFKFYRSIPELQDYVLVDQYSYFIEHYARTEEGLWLLREYDGIEGTINFVSVEVEMAIAEIYEEIAFSVQ